MVQGDVKGERDLVHVRDVFRLDLHFRDLVLGVVAENDQLFFVILFQFLRDGGSCVDGEIMPFHKTKGEGPP